MGLYRDNEKKWKLLYNGVILEDILGFSWDCRGPGQISPKAFNKLITKSGLRV